MPGPSGAEPGHPPTPACQRVSGRHVTGHSPGPQVSPAGIQPSLGEALGLRTRAVGSEPHEEGEAWVHLGTWNRMGSERLPGPSTAGRCLLGASLKGRPRVTDGPATSGEPGCGNHPLEGPRCPFVRAVSPALGPMAVWCAPLLLVERCGVMGGGSWTS